MIALDGLPHQVDQLEGSLLSEKSAVEERAAQSAAEPLKRALERKETALRSMKLKLEVVQAELSGSRAELEGAKAEVAKREARARKQSEAAHAALGVQLDALCPLPCMQVPTTARPPSFPQVCSSTGRMPTVMSFGCSSIGSPMSSSRQGRVEKRPRRPASGAPSRAVPRVRQRYASSASSAEIWSSLPTRTCK